MINVKVINKKNSRMWKLVKTHFVRTAFIDFCTHDGAGCYFTFDSSYIFYYQTYIHIYMIYVLLMFFINFWLFNDTNFI